jgi:hypothetical protein
VGEGVDGVDSRGCSDRQAGSKKRGSRMRGRNWFMQSESRCRQLFPEPFGFAQGKLRRRAQDKLRRRDVGALEALRVARGYLA